MDKTRPAEKGPELKRIALCIAVSLLSTPAAAGVYKCQQGGQTVYTDMPCPNARGVDTTNGKPPPLSDQYRARAHALREQAAVNADLAAEAREKKERKQCQRIIRDHNWTMQRAAKYKDDEWWRAEGYDSEEHLLKKCGKYLIPTGAK